MGDAESGESRANASANASTAGAFDRDVARFLHEYFEAEPVGATFFGLTEWDAQLPDFSADGFASREAAAKALAGTLLVDRGGRARGRHRSHR